MIPVTPTCLSWTLLSLCAIVLASEEQKAESGQDFTMACRVPDGKTIRMLKWSRADLKDEYVLLFRDDRFDLGNQHPSFKNRVELQDKQMNGGDVSLILKDVTAADNGEYQCQVFVGESRSWETINTFTLRVAPPPGPEEGAPVKLIVGLLVAAVLFVIVTSGGILLYRKYKQSQDSY